MKKVIYILKNLFLSLLILATGFAGQCFAASGNVENGAKIYEKRCEACHGEEGDGLGPGAERLNPPPRDFSGSLYKIVTTNFEDLLPQDENIYRMIRDGMPGTAMPGWSDILSKQDMWDLVAHLKVFGGLDEEEEGAEIDFGSQVKSSPESIAKGKELFEDRCTECHGQEGKGDASKRLKGDAGERTWPRNLTKPWTFLASNDAKDIFTRISTSIPGTQMPSFADPDSKTLLSIEERWHVANFVNSIAKTEKVVSADNTVIKALRVDVLADTVDDAKWDEVVSSTFKLIPQIIAKQRYFTPSNDTVTVKAMFTDSDIAILLEWDDRTKSIPGDEKAAEISDKELSEDGIAIQLPVVVPEGMEKPYFGMGDASHPVNIWHWQSGTTEQPQSIDLFNAKGFADIEKRDAASQGLNAKGSYDNGTWKVIFKRPLVSADDHEADIQIPEGRFIPIAFAAWDGSASEKASSHTMTTWYWLLLKPAASSKPLISAIIAALFSLAILLWWSKMAAAKSNRE